MALRSKLDAFEGERSRGTCQYNRFYNQFSPSEPAHTGRVVIRSESVESGELVSQFPQTQSTPRAKWAATQTKASKATIRGRHEHE